MNIFICTKDRICYDRFCIEFQTHGCRYIKRGHHDITVCGTGNKYYSSINCRKIHIRSKSDKCIFKTNTLQVNKSYNNVIVCIKY